MTITHYPRIHRLLAAAFALSVLACSSQAQTSRARGIDLSYRWAQGQSSKFRVQEDMTQEVSGEFSSTLQWHREFTYTERVLRADPETGAATIERTIDSVSIEVEGDGIDAARYDSADPATAENKSNPLIAPFANMQGQVIRFSIDAEGHVTELEGAVDLWSAAIEGFRGNGGGGLAGGAGALGGALKSSAPNNEAMRRQIESAMRLIPGRPVKVRESWQQQLPHATPIGTLTSDMEHTLRNIQRSRSGKLARIETTGTLKAGQPTDELGESGGDGSGLLGGLMALAGIQVNLGESSIRGETLFDAEHGKLIRQEFTITTEWSTLVKGLSGMEDLGISGEGHQRMLQRSTLERID